MAIVQTERRGIPAGHPGERVTLLRGRLGLLQRELAKESATSVDTIRRLEQGLFVPRYATLQRIAAALDTTIGYLTTPIE